MLRWMRASVSDRLSGFATPIRNRGGLDANGAFFSPIAPRLEPPGPASFASPRARCRNRPEFDSPSLRVRLAAFSPAGSTPPRAALAPLAATLLPEGTSVEDEIRRRGGLRLRPLGAGARPDRLASARASRCPAARQTPTSTRSRWFPMRRRSPLSSGMAPRSRTKVPLEEPRSRSRTPSASTAMQAWRAET